MYCGITYKQYNHPVKYKLQWNMTNIHTVNILPKSIYRLFPPSPKVHLCYFAISTRTLLLYQQTTDFFSAMISFSISRIWCEWNHTVYILLVPDFYSLHNISEFYPHSFYALVVYSFLLLTILYHIYIAYFICSPIGTNSHYF